MLVGRIHVLDQPILDFNRIKNIFLFQRLPRGYHIRDLKMVFLEK